MEKVLSRKDILLSKEDLRCRKLGVKGLFLFGSAAEKKYLLDDMIRRILVAIWVSVWVLSFASCVERTASCAVPDGVVPVYNVKDYGVKGDGVTDDAPAIQALLDSVMDWG